MNLLALETSGEFCSVALSSAAGTFARHVHCPARHTETLLPLCDEVLVEAGIPIHALEAVAFGAGPGAFTGVRIAASAAQGIALARQLPVVAVCSLMALARGGWRTTRLTRQISVLDARRGEVYWGAYEFNSDGALVQVVVPATLGAPASLRSPFLASWALVGRGVDILATAVADLAPDCINTRTCRFAEAADIAALALAVLRTGGGVDAAAAIPVYLRGAL
jgi:tRNA threonylcarbamoyladenosine biosynthesis protein TsaB